VVRKSSLKSSSPDPSAPAPPAKSVGLIQQIPDFKGPRTSDRSDGSARGVAFDNDGPRPAVMKSMSLTHVQTEGIKRAADDFSASPDQQRARERRSSNTDDVEEAVHAPRAEAPPKPRRRAQSVDSSGARRHVKEWVTAESKPLGRRMHSGISGESSHQLAEKSAKADESFRTSKEEMDDAMKMIATKALRTHFMFSSFSSRRLRKLIEKMRPVTLPPGTDLVKQGESDADRMFIVFSGGLDVKVRKDDGREIKVAFLGNQSCLGEMALLYPITRTATCTAAGEKGSGGLATTCLSLSRQKYQLTVMNLGDDDGGEDTSFSRNSSTEEDDQESVFEVAPWLESILADGGRTAADKAFSSQKLETGDVLFDGRPSCSMVAVVQRGIMGCDGDAKKGEGDLKRGDVVVVGSPGQEGLLAALHAAADPGDKGGLRLLGGSGKDWLLTARMEPNTTTRVMCMPLAELQQHLILPDDILATAGGARSLLLDSPWAYGCPTPQIDALAASGVSARAVANDEVLFSAGAVADAAYLIVEGSFKLTTPSPAGDVFVSHARVGDLLADVSAGTGTPSQVGAIATSASKVIAIGAAAMQACAWVNERALGRSYDRQLSEPRHGLAADVELHHLRMTLVIGQGAFASVALVEHEPTSSVYVVKKMNRFQIESKRATFQTTRERAIMGRLDHPTVCKMYGTFKTAESLYMVLEPLIGGELYSYMRDQDKLSEAETRFYGACVVSALGFLHDRQIMYRDLKPENIVLHASGYAKVVDFGFAKQTQSMTYTLCGTPEYLAPELILCKGHGKSVDWWAVSNLLYEMLMGAAPFVFENGMPDFSLPPTTLYQNILNPQYKFHLPPEMPGGAVDLCMRLFAFEPMYRLGTLTGGAEDVRKHPFFVNAGFDWDALLAGKVTPPFLPKVSSATDVSNFEEMSQEDPSFLMGSPVVSKPTDWDYDF